MSDSQRDGRSSRKDSGDDSEEKRMKGRDSRASQSGADSRAGGTTSRRSRKDESDSRGSRLHDKKDDDGGRKSRTPQSDDGEKKSTSSRRDSADSMAGGTTSRRSRKDESGSRGSRLDDKKDEGGGRKSMTPLGDDGERRSTSSRRDDESRRDGSDKNGATSPHDGENPNDGNEAEHVEANSVLAEVSEEGCLYGDCLLLLTDVVQRKTCLNEKDRGMLWTAFRNKTSTKRKAWRKCYEIELNSEGEMKSKAGEYKAKLSRKIVARCKSMLLLIDDYLIPHVEDPSRRDDKSNIEALVFYLKLKADAHRYMWEVVDTQEEEERKRYEDEADKAYERAYGEAVNNFGPAQPLRLGVALNYAVFHFEILDNRVKAWALAKLAADDAKPEVNKLNEETKKDTDSILASLEHNIHLWKEKR